MSKRQILNKLIDIYDLFCSTSIINAESLTISTTEYTYTYSNVDALISDLLNAIYNICGDVINV